MKLSDMKVFSDDVIRDYEGNRVVEMVERSFGSGKALLVSQILNADEQTIERIVSEMEKK